MTDDLRKPGREVEDAGDVVLGPSGTWLDAVGATALVGVVDGPSRYRAAAAEEAARVVEGLDASLVGPGERLVEGVRAIDARGSLRDTAPDALVFVLLFDLDGAAGTR